MGLLVPHSVYAGLPNTEEVLYQYSPVIILFVIMIVLIFKFK